MRKTRLNGERGGIVQSLRIANSYAMSEGRTMAKLLLIEDDSDNVPAFSTSESCTTFPSWWRRPRGKEGGEAPAFGLTTKGGTISGGAKSCDAGRTDTLRTTFVFVQPLNDSGLL